MSPGGLFFLGNHPYARVAGRTVLIPRPLFRLVQRLRGYHRPVVVESPVGSSGTARGPGYLIPFGGLCPVQGWGTVDGHMAYYRSRSAGWSFSVASKSGGDPDDEVEMQAVYESDAWSYEERRYIWPDGGYVAASVSAGCIHQAITLWRATR